MRVGGLVGQHALDDLDAGGAQDRIALPDTRVVGIAGGADDARDAGVDQRIGAGRRAAVMGAGFERDIGGGAARQLAGLGQRLRSRHAAGRRSR